MTWTKEAINKVQELKTNCSEFIYSAAEFVASQRNAEKVEVADVEIVLGFIRSCSGETS